MTQKNKKTKKGCERFSFLKGWNQVPTGKTKEVKNKIMSQLGYKSRTVWYNHLHGIVEPKITEFNVIESIFKEYGITKIWGV